MIHVHQKPVVKITCQSQACSVFTSEVKVESQDPLKGLCVFPLRHFNQAGPSSMQCPPGQSFCADSPCHVPAETQVLVHS